MSSNESGKREDQKAEQFVVAKSDEGYRVFSPMTPATQFIVTDTGDDMTCTCAEFGEHASDPDWCCLHIKAVHAFMNTQNNRGDSGAAGAVQPNGNPPPKDPPPKKGAPRSSNDASMLIKRSLSPDGRIDSLSVEFTVPVGKASSEEIKEHAARAIKLQGEIMQGFTKPASNGAAQRNGTPQPPTARNQQASGNSARLLNIEAMDTRRGRSLYINVLVNNQVAKLFGDAQQLTDALAAAGYAEWEGCIEEGIELNLPCRAVTKRNGKYLNIDRLLPAPAQTQNGGRRDRQLAH